MNHYEIYRFDHDPAIPILNPSSTMSSDSSRSASSSWRIPPSRAARARRIPVLLKGPIIQSDRSHALHQRQRRCGISPRDAARPAGRDATLGFRNTMTTTPNGVASCPRVNYDSKFPYSNLFRISGFGFRICLTDLGFDLRPHNAYYQVACNHPTTSSHGMTSPNSISTSRRLTSWNSSHRSPTASRGTMTW